MSNEEFLKMVEKAIVGGNQEINTCHPLIEILNDLNLEENYD